MLINYLFTIPKTCCLHQWAAARRVQDSGQGRFDHNETRHLRDSEAVPASDLHPQHAGGQRRPHPELRPPHRPLQQLRRPRQGEGGCLQSVNGRKKCT